MHIAKQNNKHVKCNTVYFKMSLEHREYLILSNLTTYLIDCFSGGHFNPVITLAFHLIGNRKWSKAVLLYPIAQLSGGIVGAAISRVSVIKAKINYIVSNSAKNFCNPP